jgi:hypothetical protein
MSGPVYANPGAVLRPVKAAFRAACGGGLAASLDRPCARRLSGDRPGRRNGPRPNRETLKTGAVARRVKDKPKARI